MNQKEWKKIIGYFIPIIALMLGNIFQIADVAEIETMITAIVGAVFTAIAGVVAIIGVIKNNDKKESK